MDFLRLELKTTKQKLTLLLQIILFLSLLYPVLEPKKAGAAVTLSFVRFDRHSTGAAISGTACLETTTSGTETNVEIVFPDDWTISSTASNWTVSTTNLPVKPTDGSAATAWPGIGTANSVTSQSVRFPATDLSTATFYCFHFTGASSTIGAAGNDKRGMLKTQGGAPYVDTVDWATSVVSSNADQITVTASVAAQMTFSLSGNSVSLGTLSSGSTTAGSAITETVSTNARNGWVTWVRSATDGGGGTGGAGALNSTVASAQIDSPGSHDGSPETLSTSGGYVLDVNTGSGSPTIAGEYNGTTADEGGHITYNLYRQTAHKTTPGASDTVTLVVKARSSATTPAASDYTDTLTVVAAGSF
jgi:hypothetical protein